jgi:hypothetical protein
MSEVNSTQPTDESGTPPEASIANLDMSGPIDEIDAAMAEPQPETTAPEVTDKPQEEPAATATEQSTTVKQNTLQEFSTVAEVHLQSGDELSLPSEFEQTTANAMEKAPNVNMVDNPISRDWAEVLSEGLKFQSQLGGFVPTLENQEAEFRQHVVHNNRSLAGAVPRSTVVENTNLTGERAMLRMLSHLGLGTLFQVPLWHSGFWITFKPPTESEVLELNRIMTADKIGFGRRTYGLAFSNTTSYTIDRLVSFALAHVYDITTKPEDISIANLRDHISSQDYPSLIWGFINTMYPRGFRYRRACVADPAKCNHIVEETLNVSKLQWTNKLALTEWQITHMSARQSRNKDGASVARYKEELKSIQKTKIDINVGKPNAFSFTIKTPNLREYVEAGHRWIGDIVDTVDRAMGASAEDRQREQMIMRHGQATAMRQYSHWVESIEYETNIITDSETIETVLNTLSADDDVRTEFTAKIIDYINSSTMSVIGIPVFDCPVCKKTNEGYFKMPAHRNIIPLDVTQVFFGLLTQRLERIADR